MQRCREFELDLLNGASSYKASMPERVYNMADTVNDLDEPYPGLEQEEMQDAYPDMFEDEQEDVLPARAPVDFYGKSLLTLLLCECWSRFRSYNFPDLEKYRGFAQLGVKSSSIGRYILKTFVT